MADHPLTGRREIHAFLVSMLVLSPACASPACHSRTAPEGASAASAQADPFSDHTWARSGEADGATLYRFTRDGTFRLRNGKVEIDDTHATWLPTGALSVLQRPSNRFLLRPDGESLQLTTGRGQKLILRRATPDESASLDAAVGALGATATSCADFARCMAALSLGSNEAVAATVSRDQSFSCALGLRAFGVNATSPATAKACEASPGAPLTPRPIPRPTRPPASRPLAIRAAIEDALPSSIVGLHPILFNEKSASVRVRLIGSDSAGGVLSLESHGDAWTVVSFEDDATRDDNAPDFARWTNLTSDVPAGTLPQALTSAYADLERAIASEGDLGAPLDHYLRLWHPAAAAGFVPSPDAAPDWRVEVKCSGTRCIATERAETSADPSVIESELEIVPAGSGALFVLKSQRIVK